jgi:hypothetical protein
MRRRYGLVLAVAVLAMRRRGLAAALMLLAATAASAQDDARLPPGAFRVSLDDEQHPVAGRIVGEVRNDLRVRVTDVRLEVQGLDGDKRAVGRTFAWAFGDIAPGGQTSFAFQPLPGALSYRIDVISYDIVSGVGSIEAP